MTDSHPIFDQQAWRARVEAGRATLDGARNSPGAFALVLDDLLRCLGETAGWNRFGCALLALGGYGRGEMAPHSDIDLMFLVRRDSDAGAVDEVLYPLWDLGFDVGHALRTPADCATLAASDLTAATAFLDARLLLGDAGLFDKARKKVGIRPGGSREMRRWVPKILADVEERRGRFGEISHLLEPHLKEGRGGLRDLQACRWVLACLGLDPAQCITPAVTEALQFLNQCRNALHRVADRKTDHLTFEFHRDVATRVLPEEPLAVFFERLHRAGHCIAGAWDQVAATARQEILPPRKRTPPRQLPSQAEPLAAATVAWCREGGEFPEELRAALGGGNPELLRQALTIASGRVLCSRLPLAPLLSELHDLGRLDLLLPELHAVVHQVHYDARHAFTTGVHCIETMATFENLWLERYEKREPHLTRVAGSVLHPRVVRVAALCHDLGKADGTAEHAVRGAKVARAVALRMGFDDEQAEEAAHLVRNHHVIPEIAFGEDLEDPKSWATARAAAGGNAGLDALVSLTFADLLATNPLNWSGLWSEWKRDLLLSLHCRARGFDPEDRPRSSQRAAVEQAAAALGLGDVTRSWPRIPPRQAEQVPPDLLASLLALADNLGEEPARWQVTAHGAGAVDILGVATSLPRVLSSTTGVLTQAGLDIFSFQVHTWADGPTHLWFRVEPPPAHLPASALVRRLTDGITGSEALTSDLPPPLPDRRDEAVPVQTRVRLLPGDSPFFTVLEVRCRDRKGLIRDLSRWFENLGLTVEYALVTTHGPMAQDTFHLKDIFGGRIDGEDKLRALVEGAEEVARYTP